MDDETVKKIIHEAEQAVDESKSASKSKSRLNSWNNLFYLWVISWLGYKFELFWIQFYINSEKKYSLVNLFDKFDQVR